MAAPAAGAAPSPTRQPAEPPHHHAAAAPPGHPFAAGVGAAVVALALAGSSYLGRPALAVGVGVVQLLLTLAWFAVLDTPGSLGGLVIVAAACSASDLLLLSTGGSGLGGLAGILGLALVAALAFQMQRRRRVRVAESLAGSMSAVLLGLAVATLIGLRAGRGGEQAVAAALLGGGAGLLVARWTDIPFSHPRVVTGGTRGWPGLLLGLAAGCGVGAGYGATVRLVGVSVGLRLGVVTAALALAADVAIDLGRGALAGSGHERQLAALTPVTVLLPLAIGCPAAYVAGRILLG
ncbi:MAG TPA: hypothetical protein VNG13_15950 [Mycobacteriales bacterium]|nr:hypothetical protein [Mycobacteriales bacterium]